MVREIYDDAAPVDDVTPVLGRTATAMRGVVWEFFEERAMHIEQIMRIFLRLCGDIG